MDADECFRKFTEKRPSESVDLCFTVSREAWFEDKDNSSVLIHQLEGFIEASLFIAIAYGGS